MAAMRSHGASLIALSIGLACAVGDNDEGSTTFGTSVTNGSASSPVTTVSTSVTTSDDASDDADATGSVEDDSDSGASVETEDQDTGEPQSEQPPSGMYSHCLQPASCVGLTTCFTITEGMEVVDGFCTRAPCNDAATDCDPSPGGTSVPICFEMMVGGTPTPGCALDCTSGKTCPAGMQCYTLAAGEICV